MAKVKFVPVSQHKYTGLFKGFDCALLRLSLTFKPDPNDKNNNTSSILRKQSCLLKISWLKKVIHTKLYNLVMLYLHHTKFLSCTTSVQSHSNF